MATSIAANLAHFSYSLNENIPRGHPSMRRQGSILAYSHLVHTVHTRRLPVILRGNESSGEQMIKPSPDIPILRATNGEVLRVHPLSRVVRSSARASRHNLLVEEHRIPCNLGLEQLRKGDGRAY